MSSIFTDWKTSVAGAIIIALGALNSFVGVHVPGFDMGFTASVAAGVGLIFAKDAGK